jgi:hypothetical protein
MQYTQTELAKLIETVETEFSGYLAKSEVVNSSAAPLAKAEDAKPEKKDEKSPEKKEAKPESKEEGKAPEHKEEGKAPEAEAKAPEHKEEGKEAAPAPEAHAEGKEDAGHGYDDEDMEHMHQMYSSMSEGERKAHHDAIMKCAQAEQAPAAPQGDMAMAKSESIHSAETALMKSELEATKAANEQLKKNLDGIQEFLTKLVKKTPQGKAITSLDVITKSENVQEDKQMTKSEINTILAKKSADPTLTKSDREAINAFYLNDANFNTISHLLK